MGNGEQCHEIRYFSCHTLGFYVHMYISIYGVISDFLGTVFDTRSCFHDLSTCFFRDFDVNGYERVSTCLVDSLYIHALKTELEEARF